MRIVPLPVDIELADFESRATLGPPQAMSSQDCDTVEIVRSKSKLPSGPIVDTVYARVFVSADELERISASGGHFWIGFLGVTFPPVWLAVERDG